MNELPHDRKELRSFHLFAGAGGGILADLLLGHRIVGACEIEEYPRKVLLQRQRDGILPRFPIWDDIRTFDGRPWRGEVDIVAGGFPCQDISCAGKGEGIEGERSGLWKEVARVVCEIRPRFVFVENSPQLVGRGLAVVLGDLAKMGYDAPWGVLGADDVGAPHRGSGSGLWASPAARDWKDSPGMSATGKNPDGSARVRLDQLARQVYYAEEFMTPRAGDGRGAGPGTRDNTLIDRVEKMGGCNLPEQIQMMERKIWPTPVSDDVGHRKMKYKQGGTALSCKAGGQLNPDWVEWLMGWPIGWTDLKPLETDKFQKWLQLHGEF